MNVSYRSRDWRERILSNLAATPFTITIDDESFQCQSVEGFWQGLKCQGAMREHVFGLAGLAAKRAGRGKRATTFTIGARTVRVGSPEHEGLIREAIRQKVLQDERVARALRESEGSITHRVPRRTRPIFRMEKMIQSIRRELYGH